MGKIFESKIFVFKFVGFQKDLNNYIREYIRFVGLSCFDITHLL